MRKIFIISLFLLDVLVCPAQQVTGYTSLDPENPILDAYRFLQNGKVVYNTYNLLCGNDDWDPMGVKAGVLAAEKEHGKAFSMLPVQLQITPTRVAIETGKKEAVLSAKLYRFGRYEMKGEAVKWTISSDYAPFVALRVSENGQITEISKPVSTTCYRPTCRIAIDVSGNKITASASSKATSTIKSDRPDVGTDLHMETTILPNSSGGFGIHYSGGAQAMIKDINVEWK